MAESVGIGFDFLSPAPVDALVEAGARIVLVYPDRLPAGWVDRYLAAGIGVAFIAESYATRAYEGYGAGVADGRYWDAVFDEHGYPADSIGYFVLGDTNWRDVLDHLDGIAAYARGLGDGMRRMFGAYGSREALDAGSAATAKLVRRWKVETWPNDSQDGVDLVQIANVHPGVPSIGGTDTNWLYRLDLGQWGGPTSVSSPKGESMLYRATTAATYIEAISAGSVWENAGTRMLRVDAIPAGAVVLDMPGDDIASVAYDQDHARAAAEKVLAAPVDGATAPTDLSLVDDVAWSAETTRRLEAGAIKVSGAIVVDA